MQKHYELVCVIDAGLSVDEIKKQIAAIEAHLTSVQQDKDDIWLLPVVYPIKGQDQAYFVSYHLLAAPDALTELKKELSLEKGLAKFHLFSLKSDEAFLKFADLKKTYRDMLPAEPEKEEDEEAPADEEVAAVDA